MARDNRTVTAMVREYWPLHREEAMAAYALLKSWGYFPRVPGMDTHLRLAVRIGLGRSVEEAAAKEYCYRWNLAMISPGFGVPHAMGQ